MTNRLKEICNLLPYGDCLADVGCDHGYVAEYSLKSGKFKRVIISDISKKSLQKAEKLLENYQGLVTSYVCDGFDKFEGLSDVSVIAGMGGEEISNILLKAKVLPKTLVLCPHKNTEKLRKTLIDCGYYLKRDYTFLDGNKFYDLILAIQGEDFYSAKELKFGRENLLTKNSAFIQKLKEEIEFKSSLVKSGKLSEKDLIEIKNFIDDRKEVLDETN